MYPLFETMWHCREINQICQQNNEAVLREYSLIYSSSLTASQRCGGSRAYCGNTGCEVVIHPQWDSSTLHTHSQTASYISAIKNHQSTCQHVILEERLTKRPWRKPTCTSEFIIF